MKNYDSPPSNSLPPLGKLYDSAFGSELFAFEQVTINNFLQGFFGSNALSLGLPPFAIRENIISGNWFLDARYINYLQWENSLNDALSDATNFALSLKNNKNLALSIKPYELPFQNNSLDLIIASHILDTAENPEEICHEFSRVLSSQGVIVLTMFNPRSFFWYSKKSKWILQDLGKNWRRLNEKRIIEWLKVLGLQTEQAKFGIYLPPWQTSWQTSLQTPWKNPWQIFPNFSKADTSRKLITNANFIGNRWFARFGTVYVLLAKKIVFRPKLVGRIKLSKNIAAKPATAAANVANKDNNVF